ncbi:MAG: UDP-N-acetylmuramyl pentapeptide phosphotransferase, partial [Desulfobacteraceae bacterium]
MMMDEKHIIIYLLSICLGGTGAGLVGTYGKRWALIDRPNDRSSHRFATPKGGGIGILAGFIVGSILLKLSATFWIPAAVLSIISLTGDRFEIPSLFRLLVQFAASFIFLFGLKVQHAELSYNYLVIISAAIFIVGTANYYNFMDGINGIAGITGVVGFGLLAVFTYYNDLNS